MPLDGAYGVLPGIEAAGTMGEKGLSIKNTIEVIVRLQQGPASESPDASLF
jgi:hypothetical protein